MTAKITHWLALVVAYGLARGLACRVLGLYDDAFITYRYAANLADGLGFVYNPGERVFGITTPLFGVILGGLDFLGISPVVAGRGLGLLAEATLLFLVFRNAARERYPLAGLATMSFALIDPYISRICAGGMESPLFLLASVAAVTLVGERRAGWSVILAASSVWLRPEGVITIAVVSLCILRSRQFPGWRYVAAALSLLAVPALLLWSYFGSVIPQSLQAKSEMAGTSLSYVASVFFAPARDPFQTLLTVGALASLPWALKHSAICRTVGLWVGLYAAAYLLARPQIWSWYALPVYAYKCMVTGFGVAGLAGRINIGKRSMSLVRTALLVAPILLWGLLLYRRGEAPAHRHIYRPITQFIREEMSPSDSIYAHDVGVIGYYSRGYILDHFGLVWKDVDRFDGWQDVLKELRPRWATIVTPSQYRTYLNDPELVATYRPRARFTETGDTALDPDTTRLGREWDWDYLVLQRVAGGRSGASPQERAHEEAELGRPPDVRHGDVEHEPTGGGHSQSR